MWSVKSGATKDGIAMTGALLIADGVLITGMAGAEYGSRGYVEGYDPKDGTRLWRRYTNGTWSAKTGLIPRSR